MIQPTLRIDPNDFAAVSQAFREMDTRKQSKVIRSTLRESANILRRATVSNLRASGIKVTPKMIKGIKVKVINKRGEPISKVHLMGDYRLKWYESGTSLRTSHRRGRRVNRGRIRSYNFFARAKQDKEREIFNEMERRIRKNTIRIWIR